MNPIIKPWPFIGWAIDLIGQIYPPSSKGHKFILVVLTVNFCQPSHEFTFDVGMNFISYALVLTPLV
jgi:hypothetical protein